MTRIKNGRVYRTCRDCSISEEIIKFSVQKDTRSGRTYKRNLCVPCTKERRRRNKSNWYRANRLKSIAGARKWNVENKERYNARRRKKNKFFNGIKVDEYSFTLK